jgi:hypothetical protein
VGEDVDLAGHGGSSEHGAVAVDLDRRAATARYTEYEPEWVPIALRWAVLVTLATIGPRTRGSVAPQVMGSGLGPCAPGCEVSTIFACFVRGDLEEDMGLPRTSSRRRAEASIWW